MTAAVPLDRRALWSLLAGNALTEAGIGFFLPVLPLFVRARGGGAPLVGLIFASGVVARALAQYPAGWLADRHGRRPVMIVSLLVYALLFPLYALPVPVTALVGLRFAHALAGGAYEPAVLAYAADLTPAARRGRVFSQVRGSEMAGLLVGPALGGLVAGLGLDRVFWAGAAICLGAALLLLRLPAAPAHGTAPAGGAPGVSRPWPPHRLLALLVPALALAMPIFWTFGTYGVAWSLYLTSRGASTFVVGLSYATYALPIVLAGAAGGLADRLGHVRAGTVALLTYGVLACVYPLVASVPALVLIGLLEGALTAAAIPSLNAEVSRLAPAGAQGRAQGTYQTMLNLAQVAGAVVGGTLYGLRPALAFFGAGAACAAGAGATLLLRRARRRP